MRIGELAQKSGMSASAVRFYEARGLIGPAARAANGYRTYGARDLKILAFIGRAQRLGFGLKDIAAFLAETAREGPSTETLLARLQAKLAEIDAHIADARRRRREIVVLMDELRERPPRRATASCEALGPPAVFNPR